MANPSPVTPDTEGSQGPNLGIQLPPTPPINTSAAEYQSGEAEAGIAPSHWEKWVETLRGGSRDVPEGFMPNEPGYLQRADVEQQTARQNELNGIQKLSPEQANKQYPGMPVPFNAPVDPYVADLQYSNFLHRQKSEDWAARGGPLPWYAAASAAIIPGFADPLYMAAGLGIGNAFKAAGIATSLKSVLAQNALLSAGLAIPEYQQNKAERQDVSIAGAAGQAALNTLGGTAFHYTMEGIGKALGFAWDNLYKKAPPEVKIDAVKSGIVQAETGSKIDATSAMMELKAREAGDLAGQASPYRFQPLAHSSERPHFMATDHNGAPIHFQELGPGVQAIDDGMVANNFGERVGEINVPEDTKLLDLENFASSPENKELLSQIESLSGEKVTPKEGETLKDFIARENQNSIEAGKPSDEFLMQAQEAAKSLGYEGFKGLHETDAGNKNIVHLFDENTKPSIEYQANKEITPAMSEEAKASAITESTKVEASKDYSPELAKEIRDMKHGHSYNSTPDYMDEFVNAQHEAAMNYLTEAAKTDPELADEMKEVLGREKTTDAQEKDIFKKLADCVSESLL